MSQLRKNMGTCYGRQGFMETVVLHGPLDESGTTLHRTLQLARLTSPRPSKVHALVFTDGQVREQKQRRI